MYFNKRIYFITAIVAFCSIIYEIAFAQSLTILYGQTVIRYSLTIGFYLLSLGIGTYIYYFLNKRNNRKKIIIVETLLTLFGLSTPFVIFLSDIFIDNYYLRNVLSYTFLIMIGLLSGLEIPILTAFIRENNKSLSRYSFSKILGIDYLGGLVGTIVFSLIIYDYLGIINSIILVASINLLVTLFFLRIKKVYKYLLYLLVVVFVLINIKLDYAKQISDFYFSKKLELNSLKESEKVKVETLKIETEITPYQTINLSTFKITPNEEIISKDLPTFERECLHLDLNYQFCDDTIVQYHSPFAYFPVAFQNKKDLNILIIGGGDFLLAKFLLEFDDKIKKIDHIDIDEKFVTFSKDKLKKFHEDAYKNPKFETHIEDGFSYMLNNKNNYDLIFLDTTIVRSDKMLNFVTIEFYGSIINSLKDTGSFVFYQYMDLDNEYIRNSIFNMLNKSGFKYLYPYSVPEKSLNNIESNPYYHFQETFFIASKKQKLFQDLDSNLHSKYVNQLDQKFYFNELIKKEIMLENFDNEDLNINSIFKRDPMLLKSQKVYSDIDE